MLRPGYFYGQCSELCGYYHAMMHYPDKVTSPSNIAEGDVRRRC